MQGVPASPGSPRHAIAGEAAGIVTVSLAGGRQKENNLVIGVGRNFPQHRSEPAGQVWGRPRLKNSDRVAIPLHQRLLQPRQRALGTEADLRKQIVLLAIEPPRERSQRELTTPDSEDDHLVRCRGERIQFVVGPHAPHRIESCGPEGRPPSGVLQVEPLLERAGTGGLCQAQPEKTSIDGGAGAEANGPVWILWEQVAVGGTVTIAIYLDQISIASTWKMAAIVAAQPEIVLSEKQREILRRSVKQGSEITVADWNAAQPVGYCTLCRGPAGIMLR